MSFLKYTLLMLGVFVISDFALAASVDQIEKAGTKRADHSAKLHDNNYKSAKHLAKWKQTVSDLWPGVSIKRLDTPPAHINAGDTLDISVAVDLNGLKPTDVVVECIIGTEDTQKMFQAHSHHALTAEDRESEGKAVFSIKLAPDLPGLQFYKLRVYPYHPLFAHRFEIGLMRWV